MQKKWSLLTSAMMVAMMPEMALAQENSEASEQVFQLGEITVKGAHSQASGTFVHSDDIRRQGMTDVGEAVQHEPGVVIESGGRRAETKVNIRGFDSRQVTLNIDGVPVYIPYDGNIDLSRFRTSDLSKIEITKSLGSLLEGPNNMGGSINLVTKKPTEPFEAQVDIGIEAGKNGVFKNAQSAQLGTASDHWYLTAGLSRLDQTNFPLAGGYSPEAPQVQDDEDRHRSGSESTTGNIKLGWTPNETDEYVLSYYNTQGSKESPPYAGDADETGQRVRYWDWPVWDKESLYFLTHTAFGDSYLKTRLFYDGFNNKLNSYDDDGYHTVTKRYAFRSEYDDHSIGGKVEWGHRWQRHQLKAALFIKHDEHKERDIAGDNDDPATFDNSWRTYQGRTHSLALEDTLQLAPETHLTLGYRQDRFKMTRIDDGDSNTQPSGEQNKHNYQLKLHHEIDAQTVFAGVSQKSRFPNIKDIYSYRLGSAIPNTELEAEQAMHYEVGAKGQWQRVNYQVNLFYADITDAIEGVTINPVICDGDATTNCSQNQNVGQANSKGLELSLFYPVAANADAGLDYAYVDRELGDHDLVATNAPVHTGRVFANWYATQDLELGADWFMQSERESSTDGSRTTDGYQLMNLRADYQINHQFSTQAVLKNALDQDYQISEGDPMPGRTLWVNLSAQF